MASGDQLFTRFGKQCPVGTVLFREGEVGEDMFVIQAGRIRISKESKSGDKILAVLGPGEFFGEMAILNSKPRTATAEVVEEAKLLVLDAKKFEHMVVGNVEIAVRLIKKLSGRLDAADALIDILMHRDPKARVILGLSREAEAQGKAQEDGSILVELDREGFAQQIGLTPDEAGKVLVRLARLGIAHETEEGFRIPDRMRLHEFLEFVESRDGGST